MDLQRVEPRWRDELCIIAATGPSLTAEVAEQCRGHRCIAINNAYKLLPFADILWACDAKWWLNEYDATFSGEKWSGHHDKIDNKKAAAEKYGLNVVAGDRQYNFSLSPDMIHYGREGGFQSINLAILLGANPILLVGFDMQMVNGKRHFFGEYKNTQWVRASGEDYRRQAEVIARAAAKLPPHIKIINCTPGSALTCFQLASLESCIAG